MSSVAKSSGVPKPCATSAIVPTSTRFMWRMNVSAVIQNSAGRARAQPLGCKDVALEADVFGLRGRERGEVVRPDGRRGARIQRRAVERTPHPPGGPAQPRRALAAVEVR